MPDNTQNLEKIAKQGGQVDAIVSPKTVTVCDRCLQASCWEGIFMCDEAQFAGTVEKTVDELKALS